MKNFKFSLSRFSLSKPTIADIQRVLQTYKPQITREQFGLSFRLALRELRGGLRGFWIFLACIALGVASISGVSSVSRSLMAGIGKEGRVLLGGDLSFSMLQRAPKPEEITALNKLGKVSSYVAMRSMLVTSSEEVSLIELKVVDDNYPLTGTLITKPSLSHGSLFEISDGLPGLVADPILIARLQLKIGDRVKVGEAWFTLRAALEDEPDSIGTGIGFGPRVMISKDALEQTKLIQPGSIVRWIFNIVLPDHLGSESTLENIADTFKAQFSDAGWNSRTRLKASPGFDNGIQRFTQFLTLVGLTALLVGGVGVANAVAAFVDRKRMSIATLKSLGASGQFVVAVYMMQVLLIAAIGILIGLGIGASLPYVLAWALQGILPVPLTPILAPSELFLAAFYGFLITVVFSLLPLGRAHEMSVTGLFRDQIEETHKSVRREYRDLTIVATVLLVCLSIFTAYDRLIGIIFLIAVSVCFIVLRGAAWCIMFLARQVPPLHNAKLRFAISNLYRPGALTKSLVLSLGLAISLLVALSVVEANIGQQLTQTIAARAPSYFFLDVPNKEFDKFEKHIQSITPSGELNRAPMMTGRILSINGRSISKINVDPRTRSILNGDRGVTFSAQTPKGSRLSKGAWWPEDYKGEPLVSFEEKFASNMGLRLGDIVEVNVMGLPIKAKVASFRRVDWTTLAINFFMVFTPHTFEDIPHSQLVTVSFADMPNAEVEAQLAREVAKEFPQVTSVRVKEALQAANQILGQMILAIRGASSIALIASFLVLAGALAAGQRTRLREAVILKTVGATRGTLIRIYLIEYLILGISSAVFGLVAGAAIAYAIVSLVMGFEFSILLGNAALSALMAVAVAVLFGLVSTWHILNQKPAAYLREL